MSKPQLEKLEQYLVREQKITHVVFVHCETTTGMLNPLSELASTVKKQDKVLIVDAMSSFAGVPIDVAGLGIDFLISSANKCIQGVPGFSFVIAKTAELIKCKGNAHSLSLDLYDQWHVMDSDGKWRYTSPTHVVAAFAQAIKELKQEGGIRARHQRYSDNNKNLRAGMSQLGFVSYIEESWQSPIITAFLYPYEDFNFNDFYTYVKKRGYVLYPGKLTDEDTFRIGTIGDIYKNDIEQLISIIEKYMKEEKNYDE